MAAEWIKEAAKMLAAMEDPDDRKRSLRQMSMLALNDAPEEAFEPPIRTLGKFLSDPIEIPPVLIEPFHLVRGGLNAAIGRSGKGKTVFCLNRVLRWSVGAPLFESWKDAEGTHYLKPAEDKPLKILVVENEGAAGMFHRQIGIMANAPGYLTEDQQKLAKENVWIWGEGGYSGLKLDDPAKLDGLRAGVDKWKPDIVFIEPFRSLWSGEENSATEMTTVVDALIGIASEFNCGVQIAHHERKGGHGEDDKMSAARGSGVLENFVTIMEHFESVKGGEFREWSVSKSRYEQQPNPCRMEWDHTSWWYKHVPSDMLDEAVIAELRENDDEPLTVSDFAERLDEKPDALRKVLKKLKDDGKVKAMSSVSNGRGSTGTRYRLNTHEYTGGGAAF